MESARQYLVTTLLYRLQIPLEGACHQRPAPVQEKARVRTPARTPRGTTVEYAAAAIFQDLPTTESEKTLMMPSVQRIVTTYGAGRPWSSQCMRSQRRTPSTGPERAYQCDQKDSANRDWGEKELRGKEFDH
jgi:hypothetical protein